MEKEDGNEKKKKKGSVEGKDEKTRTDVKRKRLNRKK